MIRAYSTIPYLLVYSKSRRVSGTLKYVYAVMSVKTDSLLANAKMQEIDMFVVNQSAISQIVGGMKYKRLENLGR